MISITFVLKSRLNRFPELRFAKNDRHFYYSTLLCLAVFCQAFDIVLLIIKALREEAGRLNTVTRFLSYLW